MPVPELLHDLLLRTPADWSTRAALSPAVGRPACSYAELADQVERARGAMARLGLPRGARVAVYLEKRLEMVVTCFAASAAGLVMVPLNPGLKAEQVQHVLEDSQASAWVTSLPRWHACAPALTPAWWRDADRCSLRHVVLADWVDGGSPDAPGSALEPGISVDLMSWNAFMALPGGASRPGVDNDLAALLYTSGSTGRPKGVMLSHRNLVVGARSVVTYLENRPEDVLLAVLPLSFDAGFSQLTTAFTAGARVVLLNHLLPQDVLKALSRERITGLTAVPPLYHQLSALEWPQGLDEHLRYFASTGGPMPARTLATLRRHLPRSKPYIMYGLTEAFRSTYLPPHEVDRKPGSIGRAIPQAEVFVLRPDGSPCAPGEEGELVHRGPLVGMGYWRDPERTALRFRPLPAGLTGTGTGQVLPEMAVFSGDRVRCDEEGFVYHLGRLDEQIKTSGYRVSPSEVEEVLMRHPAVDECVVFGVPDEALGQRLAAVVSLVQPSPLEVAGRTADGEADAGAAGAADAAGADVDVPGALPTTVVRALTLHSRGHLPAHLVPQQWHGLACLPRNPNGKIDRPRVVALALGETGAGHGLGQSAPVAAVAGPPLWPSELQR